MESKHLKMWRIWALEIIPIHHDTLRGPTTADVTAQRGLQALKGNSENLQSHSSLG